VASKHGEKTTLWFLHKRQATNRDDGDGDNPGGLDDDPGGFDDSPGGFDGNTGGLDDNPGGLDDYRVAQSWITARDAAVAQSSTTASDASDARFKPILIVVYMSCHVMYMEKLVMSCQRGTNHSWFFAD
jgi:hypothetical protein